jgi:shikimate dehydrogenase
LFINNHPESQRYLLWVAFFCRRMVEFGLIGKKLGHSFSKAFFSDKFATLGLPYTYHLFELEQLTDLPELWASHPHLVGLNVTIPYKQEVLQYVAHASPAVEKAGAANTLVRRADGTWAAHNTDIIGFTEALKTWLATLGRPIPTTAWVLGTGGASRAVQTALGHLGVAYLVAGRQKGLDLAGNHTLLYEELATLPVADLWVQTTPLGQSPATEEKLPLPYHLWGSAHLAYDLVYNPAETAFLQAARQQGAQTLNGLPMLHAQCSAVSPLEPARVTLAPQSIKSSAHIL